MEQETWHPFIRVFVCDASISFPATLLCVRGSPLSDQGARVVSFIELGSSESMNVSSLSARFTVRDSYVSASVSSIPSASRGCPTDVLSMGPRNYSL